MKISLADKVRAVALEKYVQTARKAGLTEFSIAVKNLQKDLEAGDFPLNYTPLVCTSIKTKSFQRDNHLEITRIDGPKSQTGTRVVVHYRFVDGGQGATASSVDYGDPVESPESRSRRLTEGLRGLLKKEVADRGGAEAFIRWVRSDDEDAA